MPSTLSKAESRPRLGGIWRVRHQSALQAGGGGLTSEWMAGERRPDGEQEGMFWKGSRIPSTLAEGRAQTSPELDG